MTELVLQNLTRDQVELLKTTICKGSTDDELRLFEAACNNLKLNPFVQQIFAVKRWDSTTNANVMAIQVGVAGYRLIADRTGCYAPGPKPTYTYDASGNLVSATAYVKKLTKDGTWHLVEAEAFYCEYVQTKKDKAPTHMWATKAHGQLAKCAECLAIKKAFPAETSGAEPEDELHGEAAVIADPVITPEQAKELDFLLYDDEDAKAKLLRWAKVSSFEEVTVSNYATMLAACKRRAAEKAKEEEKLIDVKAEVKND